MGKYPPASSWPKADAVPVLKPMPRYEGPPRIMYTGMTLDEWIKAEKDGLYPQPLEPGISKSIGEPLATLVVDPEYEAYIDGWIEGYLTRIHGTTYYAKVKVSVPASVILIPDPWGYDEEEKVQMAYFITAHIPPGNLSLVQSWEAGPELAEEIEQELEEE